MLLRRFAAVTRTSRCIDRVVAGVADIAGKIKVGPGLDPATEMGPLVSDEQFARVTGYIEDGRKSGAQGRGGRQARSAISAISSRRRCWKTPRRT